jgi:hypothetical protein
MLTYGGLAVTSAHLGFIAAELDPAARTAEEFYESG